MVAADTQAGIEPELVQHGVDEGVIRFEGNFAFLAREHSEQLPLVLLNGAKLRQFRRHNIFRRNLHLRHSVDAVVRGVAVLVVVAEQVILVVREDRRNGIDLIDFVFLAVYPAFIRVVIEIQILYLLALFQRLRDDRDGAEDVLVMAFDRIEGDDVLFDGLRLAAAGKFGNFIDEQLCLFFRNEGGCLYGVHQNLYFRHAELAVLHEVFVSLAADAVDLVAAFVESLNVGVERSPVALDVYIFQPLQQLDGTHRMRLVCFLAQNFPYLQ